MADAIVIKLTLDAGDITQANDRIKKGVTSALDAAIPSAREAGKRIGDALASGITEAMQRGIAKAKDALAAVSGGNANIGAAIVKPIKDSEAAMLRLAQATARLKQISGDTPGAIKVLSDALAKVSDPKGIAAVRAEIQKTYLTTNYSNSPLISAIKATKSGFEGLPPIISKAGSLVSGLFAGLIGGGLIAGFQQLGSVALSSAVEIDKNRQTLIALTGSADAANRKLAELRALAAQTPGLTSRVAIDVFSQLKATGQIAEDSINKLIKGVGRLNAVFTIDDAKQFSRNLVQIFQQGFERADIKEALGRVPIFEQILEKAFGTKDPAKLRKLKESGQLTLDSFASGLAEAINTNPVLANVQESLGSRFEKAKDNILVALEPLGAEIGKALLSVADSVGKQLQASQDAFKDLIASAGDFGSTLASAFSTGSIIDVQAELEALRGIIDFVNGGILFLKDSFELFGAVGESVIKGVTLFFESALAGALDLIGVKIQALEEDMLRLSSDITRANQRIDDGFKNTRAFRGRVEDRNIVVDFGNAVPVDANGRPLNPSQALPAIRPSGGGSGSGAESKARQLREALLQQQKSFIEQSNRLQEDANKRELEQFKQLYDDKKVTISEFYDAKLGLTQASIGNEINALQQEITAQEKALAAAKAGTPEKIRLETELNKLRTDLILKTRALTDAERENQTEALKALNVQRTELLKLTQGLALKLDESGLPTNAIAGATTPLQERAAQLQADAAKAALAFRVQDLQLQQQELQIQNAVSAGILTEAQGKEATLAAQRAYRDVLIQSLQIQQQALDPFNDGEAFQRISVQIEQLKTLGQELSPTQAFFKGFRSEAETLAESFERIGKSFKDSVLGVVDSGIDKLTKKLGFFKSLVGDILKSLTRVLLGGLLQPRGGGAVSSGNGGIGSFVSNVLGNLGFGRNGAGANNAASFLTPGFNPNAGNVGLLQLASGATAGIGTATTGISGIVNQALSLTEKAPNVPRSLTSPLGDLSNLPGLLANTRNPGGVPIFTQDTLTGGGQIGGGGLAGLFGNLFQGIGFGKARGSGGALAGALPLLGLSLGSSLGTDRLTSILGGAAGGLLGIGLSAAPAIIGTGGALSGLGFLAPLFSNPITAIAAGLALPAVFLLGRARQRKRDEKSSGDFLQDAINQIRDVKKQVESNELTLNVTEARKLFESQILQPFVAQINTLKSKSVRESRLKNQTVDLRNLFEKEVIPAVQAQKARQGISDKLIPEFAVGGIVPGFPTPGIDSVLARVSPGEMVLTVNHQRTIAAMAGGDVFAKAGVPSAGVVNGDGSQSFARGGFVAAASRINTTPTINMTVQLVVSGDEAVEILNAAASTDDGQQILVNARRKASRNRVN